MGQKMRKDKRSVSEHVMPPRRQTWVQFSSWGAWVTREWPEITGELGEMAVVRETDSKVQQLVGKLCLEMALTVANHWKRCEGEQLKPQTRVCRRPKQ